MRRVHCDGCGCTELENLPKHKIKSVTVLIAKDPRFPEGTDKYEADLCPNCQGMMLHQYFKIPAGGKLDLPAFIGPRKNLHEAEEDRSQADITPKSIRWDVERISG